MLFSRTLGTQGPVGLVIVNSFEMNISLKGKHLWVERGVDAVTLIPPSGLGFHHVSSDCRCYLPCPVPSALDMAMEPKLAGECRKSINYVNAFLPFVSHLP